MATPNNSFVLSPLEESDLPEFIQVMYDSFGENVRNYLMGCSDVSNMPKLQAMYIEQMRENPTAIFWKVTDQSTGKIVAASKWNLLMIPGSADKWARNVVPPWLEGDEKAGGEAIVAMVDKERLAQHQDRPFLFLHACFTHPSYQRKGAASMMLKRGCELADSLFVSCWLEASAAGAPLYRKFGYQDFIPPKEGKPIVEMRREAKTAA